MNNAILAGIAGFALTAATLAVAQPTAAPRSATRAEVAAQVRERFTQVDANGDGYLTQVEAQAAIKGRTEARRAERFDRLDANRDGQISRQEFAAPQGQALAIRDGARAGPGRAMARMRGMRSGGFGGRMFGMADSNKDSRVSLQEATDAALRRFDMVDANRDGTISPQERHQMRGKMREMRQQHRPS